MSQLTTLVARLGSAYGEPQPPQVTDPYEMALWESVAYLVDDARRARVFAALRDEVGLAPRHLLEAPEDLIAARIASGGMHPARRTEKVLACARIGEEVGVAALAALARSDPRRARRVLRRFPGIGEPGADRILMVNGSLTTLAPESNGLRVLVRYGYGEESTSYARTYRSACEAVRPELPGDDTAWLVKTHQLLRRHGQELCKASDPRCDPCPLARSCRHAPARTAGV